MPLDPTTIAGAMYYVADSWMLDNFHGLSTFKRKERDRSVTALALRYQLGQMMGISGKARVGVDVAKDRTSAA